MTDMPIVSDNPSLGTEVVTEPVGIPNERAKDVTEGSVAILPKGFLQDAEGTETVPGAILVTTISVSTARRFAVALRLVAPSLGCSEIGIWSTPGRAMGTGDAAAPVVVEVPELEDVRGMGGRRITTNPTIAQVEPTANFPMAMAWRFFSEWCHYAGGAVDIKVAEGARDITPVKESRTPIAYICTSITEA